MDMKAEYIPGTCNIGPSEIKARKIFAIYAAIFGILLIVFLLVFHADKLWRLTLFLPAASFGVGFQQWYYHFCVNFGLRGIFNFGDMGKTFSVEQKEDFKKDRMKAKKMLIIGILFGLVLTILFYFLPL